MERDSFILIVDDNEADAELIREALSNLSRPIPVRRLNGYKSTVDFFTRLDEGGAPPALVLCDVRMPGGDGTDVLRWVRKSERFNKIPFVLVTGATDAVDWNSAIALGATSFIYKNAMVKDPAQFARTIERCLGES